MGVDQHQVARPQRRGAVQQAHAAGLAQQGLHRAALVDAAAAGQRRTGGAVDAHVAFEPAADPGLQRRQQGPRQRFQRARVQRHAACTAALAPQQRQRRRAAQEPRQQQRRQAQRQGNFGPQAARLAPGRRVAAGTWRAVVDGVDGQVGRRRRRRRRRVQGHRRWRGRAPRRVAPGLPHQQHADDGHCHQRRDDGAAPQRRARGRCIARGADARSGRHIAIARSRRSAAWLPARQPLGVDGVEAALLLAVAAEHRPQPQPPALRLGGRARLRGQALQQPRGGDGLGRAGAETGGPQRLDQTGQPGFHCASRRVNNSPSARCLSKVAEARRSARWLSGLARRAAGSLLPPRCTARARSSISETPGR